MTDEREDNEIEAILRVKSALEPLGHSERQRVLAWAMGRYGTPDRVIASPAPTVRVDEAHSPPRFHSLVELFDAASPDSAAEKVLVAAYWLQVCGEQEMIMSQPINDALKDLGHGIAHMPSTIAQLETKNPALIRQVRKSGKSQQARKSYKVTEAGIKAVESMFSARS